MHAEVTMKKYDVKFVSPNEAFPPDVEVEWRESEIEMMKTLFERELATSWQALPTTKGQRRVELQSWISTMNAECWTPERTVLVRVPVR